MANYLIKRNKKSIAQAVLKDIAASGYKVKERGGDEWAG
jgi:hypothetical protein